MSRSAEAAAGPPEGGAEPGAEPRGLRAARACLATLLALLGVAAGHRRRFRRVVESRRRLGLVVARAFDGREPPSFLVQPLGLRRAAVQRLEAVSHRPPRTASSALETAVSLPQRAALALARPWRVALARRRLRDADRDLGAWAMGIEVELGLGVLQARSRLDAADAAYRGGLQRHAFLGRGARRHAALALAPVVAVFAAMGGALQSAAAALAQVPATARQRHEARRRAAAAAAAARAQAAVLAAREIALARKQALAEQQARTAELPVVAPARQDGGRSGATVAPAAVAGGLTATASTLAAGARARAGSASRSTASLVTRVGDPPELRRGSGLKWVIGPLTALVLCGLVGSAVAIPSALFVNRTVRSVEAGLPDLSELKPLAEPQRTEVLDARGHQMTVLHDVQNRVIVPLSKVSTAMQEAVVAAEDNRFYQHRGVDDRGIVRAAVANFTSGQTEQGGSTITQQYVRNTYPDLLDRTIVRKVKEAALAAQLERTMTKQQILEGYLNRVDFGAGFYGIEAASLGYFGVHASKLDVGQSAMLAGIIREPESANPWADKKRALELRNVVVARMAELGMITPALAAKITPTPLKVAKPHGVAEPDSAFMQTLKLQLLGPERVKSPREKLLAKMFPGDQRLGATYEARRSRLYGGGLRIWTTFDPDLQRAAEQAVRNHRPAKGPDAALVAIDPRTGSVPAMVGGRNRNDDWPIAAHRQAGSSFKTFTLATALEAGYSPDTMWAGEPNPEPDPPMEVCGAKYNFSNAADGEGHGNYSMAQGTWDSINGVYIRIMGVVCPRAVAAMAHRLGIVSPLLDAQGNPPGPSLTLGAYEVTPFEMASAYATLAAGGVYHHPNLYTKVTTVAGKTLFLNKPAAERRISPELAYAVTGVLKGVITQGTGTGADIGRPAAGKTGTTDTYGNAWFIGYTPDLAAAVWMGDPRGNLPMKNIVAGGVFAKEVFGGTFPAPIWHDFMSVALAGVLVSDFPSPPGRLQYDLEPPPEATIQMYVPPPDTSPAPPPDTAPPTTKKPPPTTKKPPPTTKKPPPTTKKP